VTLVKGQREAFAQAGEPKRLVEIECGHFDVCSSHLDAAQMRHANGFAPIWRAPGLDLGPFRPTIRCKGPIYEHFAGIVRFR